jgi:hypothetical protein
MTWLIFSCFFLHIFLQLMHSQIVVIPAKAGIQKLVSI